MTPATSQVVADTHVLVWYLTDSARLSSAARQALEACAADDHPIVVNSISLVEIVYAAEKTKNPVTGDQRDHIFEVLDRDDTPLFLEPVAAGLEEIAGEVDRRVTLLEQVDRELAGAFRELAACLGFPGLAPPPTLDPADPLESARAGLRAGAEAGPGRQPCQAKEADPVSTSTGNYHLDALDLAQPGRGIPTVFTRTYNSLGAEADGPLGFGWTHSWGIRLRVDDAGVTVVWGDGHEERHHPGGDGAFAGPPGVHDRLRRTAAGFELVTKAGVVHRFDADGRLVALADRSANTTHLEYNDGHLDRVTDASGAVTTLERDGRGRITAVNGVMERRWTYGYGRRGDLVAVTDPEGAVWAYAYDDDHRLVSVTDPEGAVVVRNAYDGLGRVVEQRDGAGGRWSYRYQPVATTVTDPLGHTKRFFFDERYRTTGLTDANRATTRFSWDDDNNLVAVEDPTGRTSSFAYNPRRDPISAEGPGSAPVRFEWDAEGNLAAVVSAEGDGPPSPGTTPAGPSASSPPPESPPPSPGGATACPSRSAKATVPPPATPSTPPAGWRRSPTPSARSPPPPSTRPGGPSPKPIPAAKG